MSHIQMEEPSNPGERKFKNPWMCHFGEILHSKSLSSGFTISPTPAPVPPPSPCSSKLWIVCTQQEPEIIGIPLLKHHLQPGSLYPYMGNLLEFHLPPQLWSLLKAMLEKHDGKICKSRRNWCSSIPFAPRSLLLPLPPVPTVSEKRLSRNHLLSWSKIIPREKESRTSRIIKSKEFAVMPHDPCRTQRGSTLRHWRDFFFLNKLKKKIIEIDGRGKWNSEMFLAQNLSGTLQSVTVPVYHPWTTPLIITISWVTITPRDGKIQTNSFLKEKKNATFAKHIKKYIPQRNEVRKHKVRPTECCYTSELLPCTQPRALPERIRCASSVSPQGMSPTCSQRSQRLLQSHSTAAGPAGLLQHTKAPSVQSLLLSVRLGSLHLCTLP